MPARADRERLRGTRARKAQNDGVAQAEARGSRGCRIRRNVQNFISNETPTVRGWLVNIRERVVAS